MNNKLGSEGKQGWFIIKALGGLFIASLIYSLMVYSTNFINIKPGPLYKISYDSVEKYEGSWHMTTVAVKRLKIYEYIYTYFNDKANVFPTEPANVSNDNGIDMLGAKQSAALVAESVVFGTPNVRLFITNILKSSNGEKIGLNIGDIINYVDSSEIFSYEKLVSEIADGVSSVSVIRDKKIVEFNNLSIPSGEKLGINLYPIGSTKIDIDKLKTENVSGSSGGLIFTLVLIDSLTTGDLTGNKKIAGTGTINLDGSIGAIDGVIYKYKAATDSNSDVFFVPSANFDALKNFDSKNTEIVSVDSIYDAIDYLCNEGGESTICNNI